MPRRTKAAPENTASFEFITITKPEDAGDKERRRLVRKFVMKEIGLARRRPKANPTIELLPDPRCRLGSGEVDPFARYPFDLTAADRELIANSMAALESRTSSAKVFRDVDGTQRAMRHNWFPLGYEDPATMHIILSNSASHLDCLRWAHDLKQGNKDSEIATRHYVLALEKIRRRFDDPNIPVTDGLIGAVTGMICHNETIGNYVDWKIHTKGLWMLISRRGGLHAVYDSNLRISISWIELRGAYPQDLVPQFPLPNDWLNAYSTGDFTFLSHPLPKVCRKALPPESRWSDIYEQLIDCSTETENESIRTNGASWGSSLNCGGWPNIIIYQLLEWRPMRISTCPLAVREEILRLAALLYMAPIWRKFGQFPVRPQIIVSKLLALLKDDKEDWAQMSPFKMWAIYMGVVESEQPEAAEYFPRAIAAFIYERRLRSWDEALQIVKGVLWLDSAFKDSCNLVRDEMENAVDADRLVELSNDEEEGEGAASADPSDTQG